MKTKLMLICKICGKKFCGYPYYLKTGRGKYCSSKCYGKAAKTLRGAAAAGWHGGKVEKKCKNCEKVFRIFPSRIKEDEGKFCSKKCADIFRSKNYSGSKSGHWKGGITPVMLKIRLSNASLQWRQECFVRDNFTCQKCGAIGGDMEVHHQKSFKELLQEAKKYFPLLSLYDAAMLYLPLWNINNGITLCRHCHDKTKRNKTKT